MSNVNSWKWGDNSGTVPAFRFPPLSPAPKTSLRLRPRRAVAPGSAASDPRSPKRLNSCLIDAHGQYNEVSERGDMEAAASECECVCVCLCVCVSV